MKLERLISMVYMLLNHEVYQLRHSQRSIMCPSGPFIEILRRSVQRASR